MSDETPEPQSPAPRRRMSWLRREAIDLGDMVVQIIAVVIGILLALFINNWVTQRQQRTGVDAAMRAIRGELSANRRDLRYHSAYLAAMAKRMEQSPANANQAPRPCYQWKAWTGYEGLLLTDAAYQTSIATQALANMPFKQALEVARIYGLQKLILGVEHNDDAELGDPHPNTLEYCVGTVREISQAELELSAGYGHLIGPDTDRPSKDSPASASPTSTTSPTATSTTPRKST